MNGEDPGDGGGRVPRRAAWTVLGTDIGPLLLAATENGLVNVVFHAGDAVRGRALARLSARLGAEPRQDADAPPLAEARSQVEEYFAGRRRDFTLPLDWSLISGFPREVLRALASDVPYGTVVGYGDLARRVGRPGAPRPWGWRWVPIRCRWWCPATGWWRATAVSGASAAVWRPNAPCWRWRASFPHRSSDLLPARTFGGVRRPPEMRQGPRTGGSAC